MAEFKHGGPNNVTCKYCKTEHLCNCLYCSHKILNDSGFGPKDDEYDPDHCTRCDYGDVDKYCPESCDVCTEKIDTFTEMCGDFINIDALDNSDLLTQANSFYKKLKAQLKKSVQENNKKRKREQNDIIDLTLDN